MDIFEKIGEVSTMDDSEIRKRFGTNLSTVQKVLKGLLLEQLQEEQNSNSSKPKYGKYSKKKSEPEPKESPKSSQLSGSQVNGTPSPEKK
jgi:hypothetical protein